MTPVRNACGPSGSRATSAIVEARAVRASAALLSRDEARSLTDEVKSDAERLWRKLVELYEGGAHEVLGYTSWGAYFKAEFGGSERHGYRLLDSGRVLEAVTRGSLAPPTNERQARELAPLLRDGEAQVVELWRELRERHGERVTAGLIREQVERRISREDLQAQPPPDPVETPPFPARRYRCLVIDPPWPITTIARKNRPNQGAHLEYPTMSLDEIAALAVPDLCDPRGCHVFLWVTQRFLPEGFRLFEHWGVRYHYLFTWKKPSGFTPFDQPMLNAEHALFGTFGPGLRLTRAGVKIAFDAPNRGHSVKPLEFYASVLSMTHAPRLEMFARSERDGFDVWGNEVAA